MTQFLPPNLLALFAPRDPVPYLPPTEKLVHEKKRIPYTGVADYLDYFEDPEETPAPVKVETKQEKRDRRLREKAELIAYKLEQDIALWEPQNNREATTNPYKTLFVGRLNYDTSESKLKREFETYGKIKNIKIVHDANTGKPRGYAFIEYEDESSMHAAYKRADGKKIDGRRVVVDIERGRTIEGWKPRRLGGGKGGTRRMAATIYEEDDERYKLDELIPEVKVPALRPERERERRTSRDRERKRSRDKDKKSRSRSRERKRKSRSRSKDRHRSKSRERTKKSRRSKSRDRGTGKKRSRSRERDRNREAVSNGNGNNNSDSANIKDEDNGFDN